MMLHDKIISQQFLFDHKNDHAAGLLRTAAATAHHQQRTQHTSSLHQHHLQQLHHSPPMPDIYSAYAYQQQLQQHLIGAPTALIHHHHHHQSPLSNNNINGAVEVLDLSRRCDSSETPPHKTPSPPYQAYSSTSSPAESPSGGVEQKHHKSKQLAPSSSLIPANLLYSAQAQQHTLTSFYPALYYPRSNVKQEAADSATTPPPLESQSNTVSAITPSLTVAPTASLLQTFTSAAAVAAASIAVHATNPAEPQSPIRSTSEVIASQALLTSTASNTPTSSTAVSAAALDAKSTRPFKAFPRDPLVIAANFAATDVLLDNPRVERYTEYRKRVLEQIRSSNGGSRTITNPKMRRTNSRSGSTNATPTAGDNVSSNNSESEERNAVDDSSDCDSNAGNFDKMATSTSSTSSSASANADPNANNNNSSHFSGQHKDAAYFERRRKNNAAAKKSRDRRRIKEDEIAIRAAYLERQNIELLCQIDSLKAQLTAYSSKA